ncbi:MAG: hypothetical protein AAGK00_05065 [Pseudomonadota bacterium]
MKSRYLSGAIAGAVLSGFIVSSASAQTMTTEFMQDYFPGYGPDEFPTDNGRIPIAERPTNGDGPFMPEFPEVPESPELPPEEENPPGAPPPPSSGIALTDLPAELATAQDFAASLFSCPQVDGGPLAQGTCAWTDATLGRTV